MPKIVIPIYADGDQERLGELRTTVAIAERNAVAEIVPLRIGDAEPSDAEVNAARAAFDAFVDEAAERAESWVLESLGHAEFRALLKAHPPRKTTETAADGTTKEVVDPEDAGWGVNVETFPRELLLYVDPEDSSVRTVTELKIGTRNIAKNTDALKKRIKRLSEGQFNTLWTQAYILNKAGVADPKAERFSTGTPRSNET